MRGSKLYGLGGIAGAFPSGRDDGRGPKRREYINFLERQKQQHITKKTTTLTRSSLFWRGRSITRRRRRRKR